MRVLIACEYSGVVRDAFRARGHHAISCDLLPTERPGIHWQGDVSYLLDGWEPVQYTGQCDPDGDGWCSVNDVDPAECACIGPTQEEVEYSEHAGELFARPVERPRWDLMIAHPPCTYLNVAGMHWTRRGLRDPKLTEDALAFVELLLNAPIPRIALENPVGILSTRIRKPEQIVQPYQFGHDASKATCLWLKNLPPLRVSPAWRVPGRVVTVNGKPRERWANQCDSGQNKLGPSETRGKERSKTYTGLAAAMADQWGALPLLS